VSTPMASSARARRAASARQRLPRRGWNARIGHARGKVLAPRVFGVASPRQDDGEARRREHLDQAPPVRVGPQLVQARGAVKERDEGSIRHHSHDGGGGTRPNCGGPSTR
jgi:hypothetical protein